MKKILLFASALAGLFLAGSCQKETLEPAAQGSVTYEITLPDGPQTKGEAGYELYDLHYEVYRINGTAIDKLYHNRVDLPKEGLNLPLDLLNDQTYTVIFWAQEKGSPWIDASDLQNIKLEESLSNNDHRDAFCAVDANFSHDGTQSRKVTLTRPFAQVNIATTVNNVGYDITPKQSLVTFRNIPTGYNLLKGETNATTEVTFGLNGIPGNTITVNGTTYTNVAMNYVLVADSNIDAVYYEIETANGTVKNTIPSVPVKKNYRTNIIGNLLTSNATYTIEVLPGFEGDNGAHVEVINEGVTKNINGDYEITNVKGLAYAINNLFVDANGVANTATFYVKPGNYDMAQQAIKDIIVTSGTLKVYDIEPVVTRSVVIGGVVIEGLTKALINKVEEGATVFFSGITVTDFNGADNAAALVQNNEGKVVLAGCEIDNEEGQNTKLVGGNDPVEVKKGEEEAGELIYTAEQLAAAFADESVKSIALGADITLENTLVFPEGRTATLDLRGWVLTVAEPKATYVLNNYGTLTIKDSYATGEVNARGIYNGYVAGGDPISSAKLIVESGSFNAMGTNGGAAVFNYGQLEINGGKFTSVASYSVNTQAGGKVTVNGGEILGGMYNSGCEVVINKGKIEGNRSGCHTVYNYDANVTINGGTFHNNNSGNSTIMAAGTTTIKYNGGTYSIKDGRVEGNGNTWTSCLIDSQNTATSEITAGTFNGGFRVQAGTSMTITGGSFNDCFGSNYNIYGSVSITGGTYTDANAKAFAKKYAHKDYKLVDETVVPKVYTVQIGAEKYETIQEAVNDAQDGSTITFIADVEQEDGVLITDKNLTIDLNGKTFTVSEGGSTNNRNFKVNGSSVVTIKDGTMVADGELTSGAYGTVRTEDSANVTLNNVTSYSYRGFGLNIKANTGTTITINDSEIYAKYSGGVEAAGGEIVLNNVKIIQEGVYSSGAWCSVAIGVNGGGKVTVNSGEYSAAAIATDSNAAQGTWVAYVMSSGGTLEINGGTFNGTVAETANAANACGLICADRAAVVNINGGTFNSNGAILDMRNNVGTQPNPVATLCGGTFSADPTVSGLYSSNLISVAEGYEVYKEDDLWKVGEEGIRSWAEFTEALAANETEFKLQADITYDANYQLQKAVTIDLNGKSMTLPMINIHTKTTIKNGTINGKVYARKNSEVVFENITFSGNVSDNLSTEGHLAIQGGCISIYAKDCLFSPTSVSGSQTKPLSFEGGSTHMKFENCEFKSSPYKKQVYLNSLSATGSLEFINCNFNNKTPNIMFAAACPLTNLTMSGTTKLGSVTLETNRAKDAVTADDLAYLRTMIANNSISSVRLFYAGGSSEYIR